MEIRAAGETLELRASHDGYRRLPGNPVHERRWQLGDGELVVTDRVTGGRQAIAHMHFAPGVIDDQGAGRADPGTGGTDPGTGGTDRIMGRSRDASSVISLLGGRARVALDPKFSTSRFDWCPEFGRTVQSTRADIPVQGGAASMRLSWPDSALQ
jgi:hypothetical protein